MQSDQKRFFLSFFHIHEIDRPKSLTWSFINLFRLVWIYASHFFCSHQVFILHFEVNIVAIGAMNSFVVDASSINFRMKEIFLEMWFCPSTQERRKTQTKYHRKKKINGKPQLYHRHKQQHREEKPWKRIPLIFFRRWYCATGILCQQRKKTKDKNNIQRPEVIIIALAEAATA